MTAPLNPLMVVASTKLCRMMGEVRGLQVLQQTLAGMGISAITTADDLRRFGDALATREQGMLKMIGHSLRTEAILRGAQPEK